MPGRVELTPVMAAPHQFRGSRPLEEEVQLPKGLGSPLTWDISKPLGGLTDPLEVSVLLPSPRPTKTPGTWPLPTRPQGLASPSDVHSSSVETPRLCLGSGQLVGCLEHLHEEGVDGSVTNELEEKQVL